MVLCEGYAKSVVCTGWARHRLRVQVRDSMRALTSPTTQLTHLPPHAQAVDAMADACARRWRLASMSCCWDMWREGAAAAMGQRRLKVWGDVCRHDCDVVAMVVAMVMVTITVFAILLFHRLCCAEHGGRSGTKRAPECAGLQQQRCDGFTGAAIVLEVDASAATDGGQRQCQR